MAQENKNCSICNQLGHSKFYCKNKPFKPLKRTSIYQRAVTRKELEVTDSGVKFVVIRKKKPKTPEAVAKAKAWVAFSAYIRTRDCLRFTGDKDEGMCVTCNKSLPYKKLQAGHFINSRRNAVLFDERIVYTQCYGCNVGNGGAYVEYFVFMEQEWGREKIDEFRKLKHTTVQYKLHDFKEIEVRFNTKRKELL